MSDFLENKNTVVFKVETVAGTRVEPVIPADNNVKLRFSDLPSYDIPVESIGSLANGKLGDDGMAYARRRGIGLPDMIGEVVWSGDVTQAPNWWTLAEANGWRIDTSGANPKLILDGEPSCKTLSGDIYSFACGNTPTGVKDSFRGAVGNMAISFDDTQAPFIFTISGMMGAHLLKSDVPAAAVPAYGDVDTAKADMSGSTAILIGSTAYTVSNYSCTPGNEINAQVGNNAEGTKTYRVTNNERRVSMTVTMLNVADDDPLSNMVNNNIISTVLVTSPHFITTHSNCQIMEIQPTGVNGVVSYNLTFKPESVSMEQKA